MLKPFRLHLLLIGLVSLTIRLVYLVDIADSPLWYWHKWAETDMHTFLTVASQILGGDWLVSHPYHPVHGWHRKIASAEQWQQWYGPHTFHQVPGYYYFLAAVLKLSGGSISIVRVVQAILGAVHAGLLGAIGYRLMGTAGGLTLGLLAAIYGPFVAMEPMILREGLGLLAAASAVYALLVAVQAPKTEGSATSRHASVRWIVAGVLFGLGALLKETGLVLFLASAGWVAVAGFKHLLPGGRTAVVYLLVGFALGISPYVARNVAVGAPPFAFSPQGAINFILGNAPDASSRGIVFAPSPSFRVIMDEGGGRLGATVLATLRRYEHPWDFADNVWTTFTAIWSNAEIQDNFNYEYIQMNAAILKVLPRFVCIWLPAALALTLLMARPLFPKEVKESMVPFPTLLMTLILTILVAHAAAQSLAPVMSRYRIVLVPWLMIPAAWVTVQMGTWLARRVWGPAGLCSLALGGMLALWMLWPTHPVLASQFTARPADFHVGAKLRVRQGQFHEAYDSLERGIYYFNDRGRPARALDLRRFRLALFVTLDRIPDVLEDWRLLRRLFPNDPLVRQVDALRSQEDQQPDGKETGDGPSLSPHK